MVTSTLLGINAQETFSDAFPEVVTLVIVWSVQNASYTVKYVFDNLHVICQYDIYKFDITYLFFVQK